MGMPKKLLTYRYKHYCCRIFCFFAAAVCCGKFVDVSLQQTNKKQNKKVLRQGLINRELSPVFFFNSRFIGFRFEEKKARESNEDLKSVEF